MSPTILKRIDRTATAVHHGANTAAALAAAWFISLEQAQRLLHSAFKAGAVTRCRVVNGLSRQFFYESNRT